LKFSLQILCDDPTCIGCGKKYVEKPSAHAAQCSKNKSLILGDVLSEQEKEHKSRARDKFRDAKRTRLPDLVDEPLEELDIHQGHPLHVSLFNFLYINITHRYYRHMPSQGHHIPIPVDELKLEYVDLAGPHSTSTGSFKAFGACYSHTLQFC
jgi:hypothetical protein